MLNTFRESKESQFRSCVYREQAKDNKLFIRFRSRVVIPNQPSYWFDCYLRTRRIGLAESMMKKFKSPLRVNPNGLTPEQIEEMRKLCREENHAISLYDFCLKEIQEAKTCIKNGQIKSKKKEGKLLFSVINNIPKDREFGKFLLQLVKKYTSDETIQHDNQSPEFKLFREFENRHFHNMVRHMIANGVASSSPKEVLRQMNSPEVLRSIGTLYSDVINNYIECQLLGIQNKNLFENIELSGSQLEEIYTRLNAELNSNENKIMTSSAICIYAKDLQKWIESFLTNGNFVFPGHIINFRKCMASAREFEDFIVYTFLNEIMPRYIDAEYTDFIFIKALELEDWLMKGMPEAARDGFESYLPSFKTVTDTTGNHPEIVGKQVIRPTQRITIKHTVLNKLNEMKQTKQVIATSEDIFKWIRAGMKEKFPFKDAATCQNLTYNVRLKKESISAWLKSGMSMQLPDESYGPLLDWLDTAAGRIFSKLI